MQIYLRYKDYIMLGFTILYLLFGLNLVHVISEKQSAVYKDVRFWLVIFSLAILVVLTVKGYPL